jgi:DNA-binding HxlR family transcriptional regulator
VEYELTPAPVALRPVFQSLVDWAARHSDELNLPCEGDAP